MISRSTTTKDQLQRKRRGRKEKGDSRLKVRDLFSGPNYIICSPVLLYNLYNWATLTTLWKWPHKTMSMVDIKCEPWMYSCRSGCQASGLYLLPLSKHPSIYTARPPFWHTAVLRIWFMVQFRPMYFVCIHGGYGWRKLKPDLWQF